MPRFRRGAPLAYERGEILMRAALLVAERREQLVRAMQIEAGFTAIDAAGEVNRCVVDAEAFGRGSTPARRVHRAAGRRAQPGRPICLHLADSGRRGGGDHAVQFAAQYGGAQDRAGLCRRQPGDPQAVERDADHGLPARAGAAGCRPPRRLPFGAARQRQAAETLLRDERVRFVAFTGSTEVGRTIQAIAGLRRTQMELGSIAFTIVCDDADLDRALRRSSMPATARRGKSAPRCRCCWSIARGRPRSRHG